MAFPDVLPDAVLHFFDRSASWSFREQSPMNVFGRVSAGFADDDPVAVFIPLQHRARTDTEPLAHLRGNRDLALSRDLRMSERHVTNITTVMNTPAQPSVEIEIAARSIP
jgi:hypothetical protein